MAVVKEHNSGVLASVWRAPVHYSCGIGMLCGAIFERSGRRPAWRCAAPMAAPEPPADSAPAPPAPHFTDRLPSAIEQIDYDDIHNINVRRFVVFFVYRCRMGPPCLWGATLSAGGASDVWRLSTRLSNVCCHVDVRLAVVPFRVVNWFRVLICARNWCLDVLELICLVVSYVET